MKKDFDKLLKPYVDGGTENAPVQRTLGTIVSKLMLSYKHPPDIVGAAIYKVFSKMANEGLEFKGDGTYGSKGAELFSCINAQCVDITKNKLVEVTLNKIRESCACTRMDCTEREVSIKKINRWKKIVWFCRKPRGTLRPVIWTGVITTILWVTLWLYTMV